MELIDDSRLIAGFHSDALERGGGASGLGRLGRGDDTGQGVERWLNLPAKRWCELSEVRVHVDRLLPRFEYQRLLGWDEDRRDDVTRTGQWRVERFNVLIEKRKPGFTVAAGHSTVNVC